jgi:hypothetical protein
VLTLLSAPTHRRLLSDFTARRIGSSVNRLFLRRRRRRRREEEDLSVVRY